MIIRLQPPEGVPPLLIGMSVAEARDAMTVWGNPEEVPTPPGAAPQLRVRDQELTRDIFAHFDGEGAVSAIEVWKPVVSRSQPEDVNVFYGDIDIFGSHAGEILDLIREQDIEVDDSDPFYPNCPRLTLGFNREGGDDVDEESGVARFFQSVLVGRPGYYE